MDAIETKVNALRAMGFDDTGRIRRALNLAKNDVFDAVSILTSDQNGFDELQLTDCVEMKMTASSGCESEKYGNDISGLHVPDHQKHNKYQTWKCADVDRTVGKYPLKVRNHSDNAIRNPVIPGHQSNLDINKTDRSVGHIDSYGIHRRRFPNVSHAEATENKGVIKRPDISIVHNRSRKTSIQNLEEKKIDRAKESVILPGKQESRAGQHIILSSKGAIESRQTGIPQHHNQMTPRHRGEGMRQQEIKLGQTGIQQERNQLIPRHGKEERIQHGIRRGQADKSRRPRIIGYKKLEELSCLDSGDLILQLLPYKESMQDLLDSRALKPDWIQLILQIFAKITESSMLQNILMLFSLLQNTHFLQISLPRELLQMSIKGHERVQHNFENTVKVCTRYLRFFPSSYIDLPIDTLNTILSRTQLINGDDLQDQVNLLAQTRDEIMENELRMKEVRPRDRFLNEKPPDDFRQTQTVPMKEDLNPDNITYLRPIKEKGKYENVDHYLDIQYRLLREDFIGPLRDGIKEVTDQIPRAKRLQDIKVYYKVRVLYPQCSKSCIIHRIQFDNSHLSRVIWKHSKRLIFGALVCLSNDNYQTFIFATVANRDPKDLEHGQIDVRFVDGMNTVTNVQISDVFTMIESPAYFEAYRYVLEGIQELDKNTLPLQDYIISCNADVNPPAYLISSNVPEQVLPRQIYDLQDSLGTNEKKARSVNILDLYSWPRPEDVSLNESQLEAVQQALTREFVVIQGPPGTGKTHVGLRIGHALLKNKQSWKIQDKRPMLIVCYTNHALDQFLQGLIEFGHRNLIRVGGRSTNEQLKGYNLQRRSQTIRNTLSERREIDTNLGRVRAAKGALFSEKMNYESELTDVFRNVEEIQKHMANGKLLSVYHLSQFMRSDMQKTFDELDMQTRQFKIQVLDVWLGLCPIPLEALGIDLAFHHRERTEVPVGLRRLDMVNNGMPAQGRPLLEQTFYPEGEDQEDDDYVDIEGAGNALEERWAADTEEFRPEANYEYLPQDLIIDEPQVFIDAEGFQYVGPKRKDKKRIIKQKFLACDPMTEEEVQHVRHPFMLNDNDRWRLYKYWIFKCMEGCRKKFDESGNDFDDCCKRFKEVQEEEDEIILRECDVVGMTTTCAARNRRIIRSIKPKIVIVEEAAEVLEAHVLTALSEDTQHLILIGDHKQLKPNPTVFKLAREYNLELSMFERMINNGMDCRMLNIQHRMRPEIAGLLRHVYKDLQNHETVEQYENIKGVGENMYFIEHSHAEQSDEDLKSKSNQHEAEYIVGLCRYLLLQGYRPEQITILTMYTGQLLLLKSLMPRAKFEGVRVTAVDNFQGEENDIVLLSLVRSNSDGKIGFLNIENRVCVALSRAKKGLYVIGNFNLLAEKSHLWAKIIRDLKADNKIGKSLKLTCQNHPTKIINVENVIDFKEAPEGGCNQPCIYRLLCGHVCDKACHPVDPNHKEYKCRKQCSRSLCDVGHLCKNTCHYGKLCGPCLTSVRKTVPKCNHIQSMPCNKDPANHCCNEACKQTLICGHPCAAKCGDICDNIACKVIVFQKIKCGHTVAASCSASIDKILCKEPCKAVLKCGHLCRGDCGRCQMERLHVGCKSPCERVLVCSHLCKEPCTKQCPPCKEKCQNRCPHSKCHKSCGKVCDPCREPCSWACKHHQCTMLCGQRCNRPPCNEPCDKMLKCRHPCIGMCGEKCPKLCRICNKKHVEEIFFGTEDDPDARFLELEDCRHLLEVSSLDKWMEMSQIGEDGKHVNVQLKGCPKCKTAIRRSLRYGNIVKVVLSDINDVKQKILEGEVDELRKLKRQISADIREIESKFSMDLQRNNAITNIMTMLKYRNDEILTEKLKLVLKDCSSIAHANVLQNQVQFCQHLIKLTIQLKQMEDVPDRQISTVLRSSRICTEQFSKKYKIKEQLKTLSSFIMQLTLTSQQMDDIKLELSRIAVLIYVVEIKNKLQQTSSSLTEQQTLYIEKELEHLQSGKRIGETTLDELKKSFQTIRKKIGLGSLTKEERLMIITATGLTQGHWYKCPKGHVYAIGDCGGANEGGKCPICGAAIGGSGHRLAAGNTHAGEFDGSRHAAWSEGANLENFDPEQLRRLQLEI